MNNISAEHPSTTIRATLIATAKATVFFLIVGAVFVFLQLDGKTSSTPLDEAAGKVSNRQAMELCTGAETLELCTGMEAATRPTPKQRAPRAIANAPRDTPRS